MIPLFGGALSGGFVGNVTDSLQNFSITITGTSNTATISAVDLDNSVVFFSGFSSDSTDSAQGMARLSLTNPTTVTATRGSSSNTTVVRGTVVNFNSDMLIQPIQRGTITISSGNTSNTASITAVSANSAVVFCGSSGSSEWVDDSLCHVVKTNSTTITATRQATTGNVTVSYAVIDFVPQVISSIQVATGTLSGGGSTNVDASISSVNTSRSITLYNGMITNSTGSFVAESTFTCALNDSTTVRFQRSGTSAANATLKATVVEFNTGVIKSKQASTVTLTGTTSGTAAISSIDTTKTLLNFGYCRINAPGLDELGYAYISSATQVTGVKPLASDTLIMAFEAIEFY